LRIQVGFLTIFFELGADLHHDFEMLAAGSSQGVPGPRNGPDIVAFACVVGIDVEFL
jgi:hypothetical protein